MNTEILKTNHPELKNIIQYFIFFKSEKSEMINYTTFPNTNLCLAIYKNNKILIEQKNGINHIFTYEGTQNYTSYLSGFHESNLQVTINAQIDEICIIFDPTALRRFSNISYSELLNNDKTFEALFPQCDPNFLEQLFEETNNYKRTIMLESLFLKHIKKDYLGYSMKEALFIIQNNHGIKVRDLAKKISINQSTLYRLFINQVGQNPKSFLRTIRFRNALNELLRYNKTELTTLAYQNNYADQSHFIKDFKEITGKTPSQLKHTTTVTNEELAWIYSEH
jgi:AraC-like DNA-binding protein